MPRFVGWVNHQRERIDEASVVATMTARLTGGGRQGEVVWSDRHAVLAQRAEISRLPGGAEATFSVVDGNPAGGVVFDGALTNAAEIRAALAARGRTVPGRGDAETVLHAVLEWGAQAVAKFEGLFAFAVWLPHTKELLLSRDRFAVRPLSYALLPGGVVFASELGALIQHPFVHAALDAGSLCAILGQVRVPGHNGLRGVREVRPAHVVRVNAQGSTEEPYWSLVAHPHEHDTKQTVEVVRELTEEAIVRDTAGSQPAVLLSGGLDSSAVTGLLAARGDVPRTFTVSFTGERAVSARDQPFAEAVARHLGCDHLDVLIDPARLTDPATETAAMAAKDLPTPFGDKNLTPYLLYREVAEHVPMALSGESADVLFGGRVDTREHATAHQRQTFPWIEQAQRLGMTNSIGNGLFHPDLLREVDLMGYCAERYQEACAEVPHLDGASAMDRTAREIDYLHVTRLAEQGVNHSERLAAAVGLQIRYPFADHRLFTYLYNVPWQLKSFEGREKSLLRAVVRDLLPPTILSRPKVPFPITYDAAYKRRLTTRLRALLHDTAAPVRPLLDLPAAHKAADDPRLLDRGGWLGRADAEFVLQLDAWLRHWRVPLAL